MNKLVVSSLIIIALGGIHSVFAAESASQVLQEAKGYFQKANKLQGAWVTTEGLLQKTAAAIKKGDKAQALKLAQKARFEAKQSMMQAEAQLKNWSEPPYIRE